MSRRNTLSLNDLASLNTDALRARWKKIFSTPPPVRMPREFLHKLLAQGIQERTAGGMPKTLERKLCAAVEMPKDALSEPCSLSASAQRPGTRQVRGWGGVSHEVTVIDSGFAYRGKAYRSLSEIAQLITGAHWSGPRFFGIGKTRIDERGRA